MYNFINIKDLIYTNKGFYELMGCLKNGTKTLLQAFLKNVELMPSKEILGKIVDGVIVYSTFADLKNQSQKLGEFLTTITEEREIVGIYSANRIEWTVSEYATYLSNCTNCPLYSSFTKEALTHVIMETNIRTVIASADKMSSLIETVLSKNKTNIKNVILMDRDDNVFNMCVEAGLTTYFLADILRKNHKNAVVREHPTEDDLATICYTSGTSGLPKGVMLTHKNFISQVEGFQLGSEKYGIVNLDSSNVYMSYLPLAHVLERIVFSLVFIQGGHIVFFQGDVKALQEDLKTIRPNFLTAVPRVLNLFHEKIEQKIRLLPFFKRTIFRIGVQYKLFFLRFGYVSSWFWDSLVFKTVADQFGGCIKYSLCGGAPINPDVINYLQVVLSCKIFQGYGQTEGIGANIVSPIDSVDSSSVGVPFPTTQFKLVPDPDLPPQCYNLHMRGPCITQGYYKNPEGTKAAFDKDGWLITGDVCKVRNGMFYIVGRSKDIFKTSFGEYICPETLENDFVGENIEDIFITHSPNSDYLLAIVVCTDTNISLQDIVNKIKEKGAHLVSQKKVLKYEIPAHFMLLRKLFSSYENGNFITPSMKKRRKVIEKYFEKEIEKAFKTKL